MGTSKPVQVTVDVRTLVAVTHSIGAHIGAKLGAFHSDERTLTDEFCDMFAIWAEQLPRQAEGEIELTIQKLTPHDEARRGGDLEIELATPRGSKRALLQAKVVDDIGTLRQSSRQAEARLRAQLRMAASAVGRDLTFLALYVPWRLMNGRQWPFVTWEQAFAGGTTGELESFMGVAAIPYTDLTKASGGWLHRPAMRHVATFSGTVSHLSVARVLLEIASCRRGSPAPKTYDSRLARDIPQDRTRLAMTMNAGDGWTWEEVEMRIGLHLDRPGEFDVQL